MLSLPAPLSAFDLRSSGLPRASATPAPPQPRTPPPLRQCPSPGRWFFPRLADTSHAAAAATHAAFGFSGSPAPHCSRLRDTVSLVRRHIPITQPSADQAADEPSLSSDRWVTDSAISFPLAPPRRFRATTAGRTALVGHRHDAPAPRCGCALAPPPAPGSHGAAFVRPFPAKASVRRSEERRVGK